MLELNITYDNNRIKQFLKVEYNGCFDANLSGESIVVKLLRRSMQNYSFI